MHGWIHPCGFTKTQVRFLFVLHCLVEVGCLRHYFFFFAKFLELSVSNFLFIIFSVIVNVTVIVIMEACVKVCFLEASLQFCAF